MCLLWIYILVINWNLKLWNSVCMTHSIHTKNKSKQNNLFILFFFNCACCETKLWTFAANTLSQPLLTHRNLPQDVASLFLIKFRPRMAVLRTSKFRPYHTSVLCFSSMLEAYRTRVRYVFLHTVLLRFSLLQVR